MIDRKGAVIAIVVIFIIIVVVVMMVMVIGSRWKRRSVSGRGPRLRTGVDWTRTVTRYVGCFTVVRV